MKMRRRLYNLDLQRWMLRKEPKLHTNTLLVGDIDSDIDLKSRSMNDPTAVRR